MTVKRIQGIPSQIFSLCRMTPRSVRSARLPSPNPRPLPHLPHLRAVRRALKHTISAYFYGKLFAVVGFF